MDTERRGLEFLGTLGVGGFGAVYLANLHGRDRFVRRVAVKVMREGLEATADLVARQKDEARLLGLLAHDGIVQVIDLAEVDGRPAVVMEYVEGVDLAELLKATPERLPQHAALEIVASVAGALDAAYNSTSSLTGTPLRVIHRDIKPANILLTTQGRVKVLDFGVAKADFARDGHTTNGGWGTPRFMSPEQWLGEPYGAPVDVYALGVTLFDLVADRPWERPPLARATFEAAVANQLDQQQHAVPDEVLSIIAAMTAFDPADRPLPADVGERIEAALRHTPGENISRFARRHVPAMVEARARLNAGQPLPASAAMTSVSTAPPPLSATPTDAPEPSLALPLSPRLGIAGAALVFGVATALLLTALLSFGVWRYLNPVATGEPTVSEPTEGAPVDAAPVESAPVEVAPTEPAPAEPAPAGPAPAEAPSTAPGPGATPKATSTAPTRSTSATPVRIAPSSTAAKDTPVESATWPPPAEPTPAASAPTPTSTSRPAAATFVAQVHSNPLGAVVWIDGRQVGSTPWEGPLTEGTHTVDLEIEGKRVGAHSLEVGATSPNKGLRYYADKSKWLTIKKDQ